ncbi:MAG: DUF1254 domain-containing protein [Pseudomonadota bacterium]
MRTLLSLLVLLASAAAAHFWVLTQIPSFVMSKAHQALESQYVPVHQWVQSPRQTPQTQQIVRPSPDLAYAICRFDTRDGPVAISAPIGDGYGSISIFNGQTDNIFVGDLSPGSAFERVVVSPKGAAGDVDLSGRGVALIRRLAPTREDYDRAAALVEGAICSPL